MNRYTLGTLLLAAACGFSHHTLAAEDTTFATVDHWTITNRKPGTCNMYAGFTNDASLLFTIRADGAAVASVGHEEWNIPAGNYPARLGIDDKRSWDGEAVVNVSNGFHVQVTMKFLHELALGKTLTVKAGAYHASFDLRGSNAAIAKTVECAKSSGSNPFSTR